MTVISIGGAVSEGFGLIRRRPIVVLSWALARVAFTAVTLSLMAMSAPWARIYRDLAQPDVPATFA